MEAEANSEAKPEGLSSQGAGGDQERFSEVEGNQNPGLSPGDHEPTLPSPGAKEDHEPTLPSPGAQEDHEPTLPSPGDKEDHEPTLPYQGPKRTMSLHCPHQGPKRTMSLHCPHLRPERTWKLQCPQWGLMRSRNLGPSHTDMTRVYVCSLDHSKCSTLLFRQEWSPS